MDRPIGLFDSGFGGLTVMKEVARLLPNENLIYFGDTANLPYGNKSPETVVKLALESASFLEKKQIKLLIVACHTACSHALKAIETKLRIPVIGVIEPGLQLVKPFQKIALLGTSSTIESGVYQSLILKQNPGVELYPVACPLFVPLIEEGFHNEKAAELVAAKYLQHLSGKIEGALLACTHYALMRPILQKVLGEKVVLVEPAEECALHVQKRLHANNQAILEQKKPVYTFFSSDDPKKFQKFGEIFLEKKIENVERK